MVEKNLFLADIHSGELYASSSDYALRDEGEFRGLSPLFPGASLELLTSLALFVSSNRLPAGSYRAPSTKGSGGGSIIPIASRVLHEAMANSSKSERTWQLYLDLACDLRIIKRLPQQYVIHPYGRPLIYLAKDAGDFINSCKWQAYFLDRLLYEDGEWLLSILSLLSVPENKTLSSLELGRKLRKTVLDTLTAKLLTGNTPRWAARILEEKLARRAPQRPAQIRASRSGDPDTELAERRIELEFTTRRDWLITLGLVRSANGGCCVTEAGQVIRDLVTYQSGLKLNFFTNEIIGLLSKIIPHPRREMPAQSLGVLETLFIQMTHDPMRIIETSTLVSTALFASIPVLYGERIEIYEALKQASQNGFTNLRFQSGQRTKDFLRQHIGNPTIPVTWVPVRQLSQSFKQFLIIFSLS
jgi:hypothetical protein